MQNEETQEEMPHDAVGLVHWLERLYPMPDVLHVKTSMCDEPHRLDMANKLGKVELVQLLKVRYRLDA